MLNRDVNTCTTLYKCTNLYIHMHIYSSDLAALASLCFLILKACKGTLIFSSVNNVEKTALTWLDSQDSQFFRDGLNGRFRRLQKCLTVLRYTHTRGVFRKFMETVYYDKSMHGFQNIFASK